MVRQTPAIVLNALFLHVLSLECHFLRVVCVHEDIVRFGIALYLCTFVCVFFFSVFSIDAIYVLTSAANDESCTVTAAFQWHFTCRT